MGFRLGVIPIPVSDVDLAKRFYSAQADNGWVLRERPARD
jgi:hypothetical protein